MEIIDVLDELGINYLRGGEHRHVRGSFVGVDCVWCGDVNQYHLGINPSGAVTCWKCGRHSLYSLLCHFTTPDVAKRLAGSLRRGRADFGPVPVRGSLLRPNGVGELLPAHRSYLESRSLDVDSCVRLWNVQGIGPAGRLSWRIYIPVYYRGREVSWTTRAIGKSVSPKYLSAAPSEQSIPSLKSVVYGLDYVRNAVIVHEGPLDVWRTGPGSVALFGLQYSWDQVRLLADVPVRVVCLDRGRKAQTVAKKLTAELGTFPGETYRVELESGSDPGDADESELRELRDKFLETTIGR